MIIWLVEHVFYNVASVLEACVIRVFIFCDATHEEYCCGLKTHQIEKVELELVMEMSLNYLSNRLLIQ